MSVVVYDDVWEAAQKMPKSQRAPFVYAVVNYCFTGEEPQGSPPWLPTFIVLKFRLTKGAEASAKASEKGRAMANARWGKKDAQADATAYAPACATADALEVVIDIDKEKPPNGGKEKAARFKPPTPEEVDAYIAEMGYSGFTGDEFCDHYAANGWIRGKTHVKDWKACVRTWAHGRKGVQNDKEPEVSAYAAYD